MPLRQTIAFLEDHPSDGSATKFGGQPDWIDEPQWPHSKTSGNPMRFICQVALDRNVFADAKGKMAYIFITDEDEYVDGTWEPDGGENCVVIQPCNTPLAVRTSDQPTGPTLYTMCSVTGKSRLVPIAREYGVKLTLAEDTAFQPSSVRQTWDDQKFDEYAASLDGNKIGGTPIFLQNDEFPDEEPWQLLLQLDSTQVPFSVNFGDSGVAYAFINAEGTIGKLLWQCA